MALGSALKDKARVIRTGLTGERVEGGYKKADSEGPWFRCFYDAGSEGESRSEGGVHRRRSGARLICGTRASDGSLIDIDGSDVIEIDSPGHGRLRMDVTGAAERLVKGRRLIGWDVPLGKTDRKAAG